MYVLDLWKPALYASAVVDDIVPATFSLRGWHHLLGLGSNVSCLQLSDLSKMVSTARRTAHAHHFCKPELNSSS